MVTVSIVDIVYTDTHGQILTHKFYQKLSLLKPIGTYCMSIDY